MGSDMPILNYIGILRLTVRIATLQYWKIEVMGKYLSTNTAVVNKGAHTSFVDTHSTERSNTVDSKFCTSCIVNGCAKQQDLEESSDTII
jgi:hypothetical protein